MMDDKTTAERAAEARYPRSTDDTRLTAPRDIVTAAVRAGMNVQARMAFMNGAKWQAEQQRPVLTREQIIDVLAAKRSHKIRENGRGGYECTVGDFGVDWTSADHDRIVRHVNGFIADALLSLGDVPTTGDNR